MYSDNTNAGSFLASIEEIVHNWEDIIIENPENATNKRGRPRLLEQRTRLLEEIREVLNIWKLMFAVFVNNLDILKGHKICNYIT